jgi:signal transduction histidine kinase
VANAIKFTEEGSVEVRAGITDESSEESPIVYFEVSDTGVGIPPERLNDIFKPFTQVGRFGSTISKEPVWGFPFAVSWSI